MIFRKEVSNDKNTLQLEIVHTEQKYFQGEVSEASFPGAGGAFQVF